MGNNSNDLKLKGVSQDAVLESTIKFLSSKKTISIVVLITVLGTLIMPFSIIIVPLVYLGILSSIKTQIRHRKFMRQFAESNNFEFVDIIDIKTLKGRLFQKGHSKIANSAVIGEYNNFPIRIFNYRYTVGSGKNSTTYRFTIAEIEVEKTEFPHIFLKSDSMFRHAMTDFFGQDKDIKISIEKEFDKHFNLYCTQDYEIEVLQIFTKDLLKFLTKEGNHFSIEFAENKIYIYDDLIIKNQNQIDKLLNISQGILNKSGGLLRRLHDDFEAMHQSYKKD